MSADREPLRVELPARTDMLGPSRALVSAWLSAVGADDDGEWPLVVTELLTNASAAMGHAGSVWFDLAVVGCDIRLRVGDHGPGFEPGDDDLPGPESPRGRGLHLVNALCEDLSVRRENASTIVRCHRPRCVGADR